MQKCNWSTFDVYIVHLQYKNIKYTNLNHLLNKLIVIDIFFIKI